MTNSEKPTLRMSNLRPVADPKIARAAIDMLAMNTPAPLIWPTYEQYVRSEPQGRPSDSHPLMAHLRKMGLR